MAKNFLALVNDTLKRASVIQGDAGTLTSFTSTERQVDIDICKAVINDVIQEVYSIGDLPRSYKEGRFTLALNQREYQTETDFEMMGYDEIIDQTNGYVLTQYPGGFEKMWKDQPIPGDFDGQPTHWALNPANSNIRIDADPSASQVGDVYRYMYVKSLSLSATTDLLPFTDQAAEALTGAFAQAFKLERSPRDFNAAIFNTSFARGIRYITQSRNPKSYA